MQAYTLKEWEHALRTTSGEHLAKRRIDALNAKVELSIGMQSKPIALCSVLG